jgi:phosphocarrier protein
MIERQVQVMNKNGIHARPAAEIAKVAGRYACDVMLAFEDVEVNAKSVLGVMMLAAGPGSMLRLRLNGPDAEEAAAALSQAISRKFEED